MKLSVDVLQNYEYARQPEIVQPALKFDNRAVAIQSLQSWATARNSSEKPAALEGEVPSNAASEFLADSYADTVAPQGAYLRWEGTR